MKKSIISKVLMAAGAVMFSFSVQAQTKTEAGKVIDKTQEATKKAADKTAEKAVKGVSEVKDKTYKGKMAPDGSNVYIDNRKRTYYVDKKGKKIFLKPSQIKDRPND